MHKKDIVLVGLGTSLTARGGWLDALAIGLSKRWRARVKAINLGGGGKASPWGVSMLPRVVAARPDIVLVEFSVNDADIRLGVSLEQSRANARRIVDELKRRCPGVRICLMTMSPVLGVKALLRPMLGAYYDVWRAVAAESRVELIDIYPLWRRQSAARLRAMIPDGTHPTDAAALAITLPAVEHALSR
ncbi:SGNH/GDSL hydrolase family protein [Caulobacter sp. Root655]|uniref:SGNH/GDSL hydrolase family protein n=1 Tax=Caulobacter sp. Root655 TaxID=1736578 RepID=UPI0009E801BE|nr:SGNH/GDSL hydrolase family protein [Caulobacter sp. Root655]